MSFRIFVPLAFLVLLLNRVLIGQQTNELIFEFNFPSQKIKQGDRLIVELTGDLVEEILNTSYTAKTSNQQGGFPISPLLPIECTVKEILEDRKLLVKGAYEIGLQDQKTNEWITERKLLTIEACISTEFMRFPLLEDQVLKKLGMELPPRLPDFEASMIPTVRVTEISNGTLTLWGNPRRVVPQ